MIDRRVLLLDEVARRTLNRGDVLERGGAELGTSNALVVKYVTLLREVRQVIVLDPIALDLRVLWLRHAHTLRGVDHRRERAIAKVDAQHAAKSVASKREHRRFTAANH